MSHLRRRRFLLATGALLAAPFAAAQQPTRGYRVGVVCSFSPLTGQEYLAVLRERLAMHGFVDGRNLVIEPRFSGFSRDQAEAHARELIANKADAIFVVTTPLTLGVQAATQSVPIVFAWVADPVFSGIVKDYRRPGGNATGVTNRFFELMVKRLELVHELFPAAKRVAAIASASDTITQTALRLAQPAADRLGIEFVRQTAVPSAAANGWAPGVQAAAQSGAQALLVGVPFRTLWMRDPTQEIVDQAMKERIPVVFAERESVELGGLISYATSPTEDLRRGADYIARVLKGESASTLPVDQASNIELALNLKTARAIGLDVPPSILARANRVIE